MFRPIEELLDKPEVLSKIPALFATERQDEENHLFLMRFYHPLSKDQWFVVEYDPEERVFFGWTDGDFQEWGYFSLLEMAFVNVRGVPIMCYVAHHITHVMFPSQLCGQFSPEPCFPRAPPPFWTHNSSE